MKSLLKSVWKYIIHTCIAICDLVEQYVFFPEPIILRRKIQKELQTKYHNWRNLYAKLHGYYPSCVMCGKRQNNSDCLRSKTDNMKRPWIKTEGHACCMDFAYNPDDAISVFTMEQAKKEYEREESLKNGKN